MISLPEPRRIFKLLLGSMGVLLAIPLVYFTAALIGSLIPANPSWKQSDGGVTIFVRTNGVHTWIMVPKVAAGVDWRRIARPEHIQDPRYARGNYLAIGYGNRDFYLNTPTWGDLSLRTAFAAARGGGPSLVHVEHEWNPRANGDQRPLVLSLGEYRKLAAHLRASFDLVAGHAKPLLGRGYGPADVFYEARGPYNAYRTCNEWTGESLRAAGIRTGLWTPLAESIMLRLKAR
jgi:uncharacterized protein (TIGR02117 family)